MSSKEPHFHGTKWQSASSMSTKTTKYERGASTLRKQVSPVRTRAVAEQLAVSATSAQAALERAGGSRSTVVPINRENDVLPPHIKSILKLLHENIERLEKFLAHISRWTSSEIHAANSKISSMLTSQRTALDDLALFCDQEARYAAERVSDLAAQVRKSEQDVSLQVLSLRFLYNIVNNATNICNAQEGLLFLFPTGSSGESKADDRNLLMLAAHVSAKQFSPLADGSTHSDIYDLCKAVARSNCAVNLTSKTSGTPMNFDTIIACPVFMPQRHSTCLGVLCLINKVSPYGETKFNQMDESRLVAAAEHIAETATSMPLNVAQSSTLVLSPSTWQQEFRRWHNRESTGTGIDTTLREAPPTQFIFRSEYSGTALAKMNFKSRNAIEPGEVMLDVLGRYKSLEAQLDVANKRANQALGRVHDAEDRLLHAKEETRKAVKDAYDMRVANERVLRSAVFSSRIEKDNVTALEETRTVTPQSGESPLQAAQTPRASPKVPQRFVRSAQTSRMKSFFPSPPSGWNSKAKPMATKPFLSM